MTRGSRYKQWAEYDKLLMQNLDMHNNIQNKQKNVQSMPREKLNRLNSKREIAAACAFRHE